MSKSSNFAGGVRVRSLSKENLRERARTIRKGLHLEEIARFPVVRFLEFLQGIKDDFDYEVVAPGILPKEMYACYDPFTGIMKIEETFYNMANEGNGFARWTILHECSHYFLHRDQMSALTQCNTHPLKAYEDSEWQANTLTCELMLPSEMLNEDMTPEEVAEMFGVSLQAAKNRLAQIHTQKEAVQKIKEFWKCV